MADSSNLVAGKVRSKQGLMESVMEFRCSYKLNQVEEGSSLVGKDCITGKLVTEAISIIKVLFLTVSILKEFFIVHVIKTSIL